MLEKLKGIKKNRFGHYLCEYRCFCGKVRFMYRDKVDSGKTQSCGCNRYKNGHGMHHHRLYSVWNGMMSRCFNHNNQAYKNYGGRGITVCDRWKDIKLFIEDMYPSFSESLSLDRIDVNGNYCKDNCRWATRFEQQKNRRYNIYYKGECLSDAARRLGCNPSTLSERIKLGWDLEDVFNKSVKKIKKKITYPTS